VASTPQFANTPNLGTNLTAARISTANTGLTGTGTVATLITGGASGTRVDRVSVKATATTTPGMIRFFLFDAQGTPAKRLLHEMPVLAVTPAGSIQAFESEWVRTDGQPLVIVPSGWSLCVSTNNAESFDVVPVVSGDY